MPLNLDLEKHNVETLIARLTASTRGCGFLVNLAMAFRKNLLSPDKVFSVLKNLKAADIQKLREVELLALLQAELQEPTVGLYKNNPRDNDIMPFCGGGNIVIVMSWSAYEAYYAHADDLMGGHRMNVMPLGAKTKRYKAGAVTGPLFWAAPHCRFTNPNPTKDEAENSRDTLGLVHHFASVRLVALHMSLPETAKAYRPTVVEAIPNSRFRQVNPSQPTEDRWGYTVDLNKLNHCTNHTHDDLSGVPEMVFDRVALDDCAIDGFYHLGQTRTDRDTNHADDAFHMHLLQGAMIGEYLEYLKAKLGL